MISTGKMSIVLVALLGTAAVAQAQWPLGKDLIEATSKKEAGVQVTATGRFQIFISPNQREHTFMLDTDTGKIWIMTKDNLSGNFTMDRVQVEEVDKQWKPAKEKAQEPSSAK